MNIYLISSLILTALAGIFSLTRHLQMLQQNSYFPSRYTKWLKENIQSVQVFSFLISSLLFCFGLYIFMSLFSAFLLGWNTYSSINLQKKSIKKLVFTGRIKRLYSAASILLLIFIILYFFSYETFIGRLAAALILLLSYIAPILLYLCWAFTLPIEKAFTNFYINDAKRILKEHKDLIVIGITGSYGKTTSKFILTRILNEKYNVVCTPHSFNTPMGVVRTIRENLKPQTQIFVCEMGAKNIGDIKEICDIVNPDIGMITSVGPQHLETFKTVDNVFLTKFELADAVNSKNGVVFVNGDSNEILKRIDNSSFSVYGTKSDFNFFAKDISYGRNGSEFTIDINGKSLKLSTKLLGLHSIINIIGAVSIAKHLEVSDEDIMFAVSSLKPTEHRLEIKPTVNGSLMIDDAYNANPEGCLEAVRVLGSFEGMKKAIITPGLIELGDKEYEYNFNLGLEAAKYCDIMIFVGKNRSKPLTDAAKKSEFSEDDYFVAESFREAMEIFLKFADDNWVVLIENDLPDNYLN